MCDDGTFCPRADNVHCCFDHQGIREIHYHYTAPFPTIAASLSEFYAANAYQIATIMSSSSNTLSTNTLSISTSRSPTRSTPSTSTISSQTKSTASPSATSERPPIDQRKATSGLNPSTKVGIGVGVILGVSLIGTLLYFLVHRRRRQHQRSIVHAGTSINADIEWPGSRRYEKPELTGEDTRKELDATERRRPELAGEETRIEMDAMEGGNGIIHELLV